MSLQSVVRGRVWLPGDEGFDGVRRPWNLAVEQPVAAVVEAADAADVVALVRHAAATGVSIATQPSGHGASGRTDGTILLRTGKLDHIVVDGRTARIGAGVRSGELQAAAASHGLTGLPGSSPVVSVTGVALGGGLSWFGRAFGWVADSVVAFDVVDASGTLRRVTGESDPDLFWALRGGGGDYAIVVGLEVALRAAPSVVGGRMLWDAGQTRAVADAFRSLVPDAPDELTAWLELVHFPGAEPMVAVDTTFLGDEETARKLLAPLDALPAPMVDSRRTMAVSELGSITAEPTDPSPGMGRAELLTSLDDALDTLLAEPIAPLMAVQVRHLGGALARESDSPHGALAEPFLAYLFGPPTPAVAARQRELAEALPTSGRKPVTFLNPEESLSDALPPEAIARLRRIKADRDPQGVFRANFSA
ncbi:FAD-binding oxidoreductase [Virgisporangium aurantiacum]|uniref:FAD-linked oxidase n=1 Tax=Virgisporangium aurantiacum TaxID=175570 RepID=A0A8J3Z7K8_9ACTN|nr:FAD-binding protein [Virgisporangium aurantiacum]GIJ56420.1 FAD-linked oxidase [Virgisporangium aurantiacum]